jgi:hypothetical protein
VGKPSERIVIIEQNPLTGEVDRQQVLQVVSDFIGTLFAVGGKLQIAADRVEIGEVLVGERPQKLAETQGLVIRYQSFAPARAAEAQPEPLEEPAEPLEPDAPLTGEELADHFPAIPDGAVEHEPGEIDLPVSDRGDLLTPDEIEALMAAERAAAARA